MNKEAKARIKINELLTGCAIFHDNRKLIRFAAHEEKVKKAISAKETT